MRDNEKMTGKQRLTPLRGQSAHDALERMREVWDAVENNPRIQGAVVLLGERGIGTSHVVEHFRMSMKDTGTSLWWAPDDDLDLLPELQELTKPDVAAVLETDDLTILNGIGMDLLSMTPGIGTFVTATSVLYKLWNQVRRSRTGHVWEEEGSRRTLRAAQLIGLASLRRPVVLVIDRPRQASAALDLASALLESTGVNILVVVVADGLEAARQAQRPLSGPSSLGGFIRRYRPSPFSSEHPEWRVCSLTPLADAEILQILDDRAQVESTPEIVRLSAGLPAIASLLCDQLQVGIPLPDCVKADQSPLRIYLDGIIDTCVQRGDLSEPVREACGQLPGLRQAEVPLDLVSRTAALMMLRTEFWLGFSPEEAAWRTPLYSAVFHRGPTRSISTPHGQISSNVLTALAVHAARAREFERVVEGTSARSWLDIVTTPNISVSQESAPSLVLRQASEAVELARDSYGLASAEYVGALWYLATVLSVVQRHGEAVTQYESALAIMSAIPDTTIDQTGSRRAMVVLALLEAELEAQWMAGLLDRALQAASAHYTLTSCVMANDDQALLRSARYLLIALGRMQDTAGAIALINRHLPQIDDSDTLPGEELTRFISQVSMTLGNLSYGWQGIELLENLIVRPLRRRGISTNSGRHAVEMLARSYYAVGAIDAATELAESVVSSNEEYDTTAMAAGLLLARCGLDFGKQNVPNLLEIMTRFRVEFGDTYDHTAEARELYAEFLVNEHRADEAIVVSTEALRVFEATRDVLRHVGNYTSSLMLVATSYFAAERFDEAREFMLRAIAQVDRSPDGASEWLRWFQRGRALSEPACLIRCLRLKLLGERMLNLHSTAHFAMAVRLGQAIVPEMRRFYPPETEILCAAERCVVQSMRETGDLTLAISFAEDVYRRTLGELTSEHPNTVLALFSLAVSLERVADRRADALLAYRAVLNFRGAEFDDLDRMWAQSRDAIEALS